jgi:broad specificity phosphatase PhoE
MMTTVLLVRHGQTAWNLEDRFRGQVDLPLDDHGLEQAEVVGIDIDFGEFSGLTPEAAASQYPDLARAWRRTPHTVHFPDGELLADVRDRAEAALREIVANHPDQTVVLVTHVVVCRLLLCSLLGVDSDHFWQFQPAIASISVFEISGERSVLLSVNDTCHLATVHTS